MAIQLASLKKTGLAAGFFATLCLIPQQVLAQKSQAIIPKVLNSANKEIWNKYELGRDPYDRMTVPVQVNGNGPFNFIIDTGAERSIVSQELRDNVGLPRGRDMVVRSVVGANVMETAHIEHLAVAKRRINVHNSPVLQGEHIGADGILGLDMLRSQRVTFDFLNDEVHVAPSSLRTNETEDFTDDANVDRVAVPARIRRGNMVVSNSRVKSAEIPVVIDTGAEVSIGNSMLKRLLMRTTGKDSETGSLREVRLAKIQTVTGETGYVEVMIIERLNIGGVMMNNLVVAFAPTRLFKHLGYENRPALLLGMDALRKFDRVQIDFGARKVRFDVPVEGRLLATETRLASLDRSSDKVRAD